VFDSRAIVIDGVPPEDFEITDVVTVGGNVFDNIWNSTNTSVIISVPILNVDGDPDNTLTNGTIQIHGTDGTLPLTLQDIGDAHTITSAEAAAGLADINISDLSNLSEITAEATIEDLDAYGEGQSISFTATITDLGRNETTGSVASGSALLIDTTPLVFQGVTSTTADYDYGLGSGINIKVNFNGTGSLIGGDLEIDHNGSTDDFKINPMAIATDGTDFYVQGTYTVSAGDVTYPDFLDVEEITLGNGAELLDASGNPTTVFTIDPDNSLDEPHKIVIDAQVPADFDVGEVITVTDAVVAGKWNSYNTQVQIEVPIPEIGNPLSDDGSLEGGTVQVLSKLDDGDFANLGSSHTIVDTDISTTIVIEIDDEILGSTKGIEEIDDFADGKTITFSAIITDKFGNATTGTASTTTLFIDVTVITSPTSKSAGTWASITILCGSSRLLSGSMVKTVVGLPEASRSSAPLPKVISSTSKKSG
jgi:hypothetical protein